MKGFIIVVLIVAAFLGGFVPFYMKNRDLERKLERSEAAGKEIEERVGETERRLRVASLQSQIGRMLIDVQQNDFNAAKAQSTQFFNDLRREVFELRDEDLRKRLMAILDRRDEITEDLALKNRQAAEKLRELYLGYPHSGSIDQAESGSKGGASVPPSSVNKEDAAK